MLKTRNLNLQSMASKEVTEVLSMILIEAFTTAKLQHKNTIHHGGFLPRLVVTNIVQYHK